MPELLIGFGAFCLILAFARTYRPMMDMGSALEAMRPENFDNGGREKLERDLGIGPIPRPRHPDHR